MVISTDRLKHSYAVARKMMELADIKYGLNIEDAFILGMVHDIGYQFVIDSESHANVGGLVLKEQGYKYWKEVYYHGVFQTEYNSPMLTLLNYADMTTNSLGEYVTLNERYNDVVKRYGKGAPQELEVAKLVKFLAQQN